MKKLAIIFILICVFPLFNGCKGDESMQEDQEFEMIGVVKDINDKIEIDVIESDYAYGIYWVITFEKTKYVDVNDNEISKGDVQIGDKVEIVYNGQTMMSFPPQVVAYSVKVIEKSEI